MNKEEILVAIEKMTVIELVELIAALEKKFGVSATPPEIITTGQPVEKAIAEEQTEFAVHLIGFGNKKIPVIKIVRASTDLALKEAKTLVDSAPCIIKENLSESDALKLQQDLQALGATVEIK